jgi:hypothetical protein
VVQQGVTTLENTLRAAKVAEAAAATSTPDALSMLMLDAMKANAQAAEKQAAEISRLSTRVAAMTAHNDDEDDLAAIDTSNVQRDQRGGRPRELKSTPQNKQRENYASNKPATGPRSFRPGDQPQQTCGRCGLTHPKGRCRADGAECRQCGRKGHFARVCRTARPARD